MSFTVLWTPSSEQHLAAVWLVADDRNGVASAADTSDKLLARDPASRGESRFDTVRTLTVPPLGVDYEVIEEDRIVFVLTVWDVSKGEPG